MRALLPVFVVSLVASLQAPAWAQAPLREGTADLAAGIRQVEEGDLEAATATLEAVVRHLKAERGREKDVAAAHLYLAMAHLGLSQWERAKGEMREAWRNNRELTLDPKKYPPRVIQILDEVKLAEGAALGPAEPQALQTAPELATKEKKGSGGKVALLLGGLAAVGGGVALAAGGGGGGGSGGGTTTPNTPPTVRPSVTATVSPEGTAIVDVTVLTFTATPMTLAAPAFSWDFGDGTTGTGQTVTHTYHGEGSFTATVTATGEGGSATASVAGVRVRSVTGGWGDGRREDYELAQQGSRVSGAFRVVCSDGAKTWVCNTGPAQGTIRHPRAISISSDDECKFELAGEFDTDLMAMSGQRCPGPVDRTDCGICQAVRFLRK